MQYPYYVFEYKQLEEVKNQLKSFKGTYICWKLVTLTKTLVERSQYFAKLLSIFINLGQQALLFE